MDPSHIDPSNSYIQFLIISTIIVGLVYAYAYWKSGANNEWE